MGKNLQANVKLNEFLLITNYN